MAELINPNPEIHEVKKITRLAEDVNDEDTPEPVDAIEIFDLIRVVKDPEHPNTLEQLNVLSADGIELKEASNEVLVWIRPTVTHCSQATLIGLCVRVKLLRTLPPKYKVDLKIVPGTHDQEVQVNKQLNDKERVAAALENPKLLELVNTCLVPFDH
eukprot:TRINITY_DN25595_c0_g1_i1.p1 TRINITY_DN25595_c0_g1~~TRINITY_DN25595_c0_g1_i1.p1  ORF type:complete len:157 (+),score=60.71 TRINITY_DN25595_c0_g1_i1:98-568(+)